MTNVYEIKESDTLVIAHCKNNKQFGILKVYPNLKDGDVIYEDVDVSEVVKVQKEKFKQAIYDEYWDSFFPNGKKTKEFLEKLYSIVDKP